MDRFTVNTAKSQIGFIDVIAFPTFDIMKMFLPTLQEYIENMNENKLKWKEKIEKYEEELSKIIILNSNGNFIRNN